MSLIEQLAQCVIMRQRLADQWPSACENIKQSAHTAVGRLAWFFVMDPGPLRGLQVFLIQVRMAQNLATIDVGYASYQALETDNKSGTDLIEWQSPRSICIRSQKIARTLGTMLLGAGRAGAAEAFNASLAHVSSGRT